ncbi:MAG: lysophospholipid acyltransferase family protein [Candidatus Omnitrophota bacterium]
MVYWIAHYIIVLITKIFCPVVVHGIEHVPKKSGYILASNHLSNLDPMLLGVACGQRLSYVAKDSLFKNKILKILLPQVGAFPIRRNRFDIGAIKEALRRLNKGGGTVIFPEGTRLAGEGKKRVQPGIGLLAVKGHVPIIPAHIEGSEKVLPPGANFLRCFRHRIHIAFGEPLFFLPDKTYPEIAVEVVQKIKSLSR